MMGKEKPVPLGEHRPDADDGTAAKQPIALGCTPRSRSRQSAIRVWKRHPLADQLREVAATVAQIERNRDREAVGWALAFARRRLIAIAEQIETGNA